MNRLKWIDEMGVATMSNTNLWQTIGESCLADEVQCVEQLRSALSSSSTDQAAIETRARGWVTTLRQHSKPHGFEALLREYPLSTAEGIALMCLAESLLRIPDAYTADRLLRDVLNSVEWERHLGNGPTLFVNAASCGLALCGRWLNITERPTGSGLAWLQQLTKTLGAPLLRRAMTQAMRELAKQFVIGESLSALSKRITQDWANGETHSFDMLGEAALTAADSARYLEAYRAAIRQASAWQPPAGIERPGISVKLSALHPRYGTQQRPWLERELLPSLLLLAEEANAAAIDLTIDAEEADRLELSLRLFEQLIAQTAAPTRARIGLVVQAYSKRALPVLHWLADLAIRFDTRIKVRLVKGAYWDTEIKRAQQRGLTGYPVFTSKAATDISYLACAYWLLEHPREFFPQFATHNATTIAAVLQRQPDAAHYEFQRLHGMGSELYNAIYAQNPGVRCRVYAPVGEYRELLPYLVRRLLENGANTSFMNHLYDTTKPIDELVMHPLRLWPPKTNPLPSPLDLWPRRPNSTGIYLHNEIDRNPFFSELKNYCDRQYGDIACASALIVHNPYNNEIVGGWQSTNIAQLNAMVANARSQQQQWQSTAVEARATCLEKYADLLVAHRAELVMLMARETGKTLENGLDEIREAIDLCRYYAQQAGELSTTATHLPGTVGEENQLSWMSRGVFVCISPWNFPLAIFSGQIAAALAMGNAVLAKPAEQATLTAQFATDLLHRAGVPTAIMQLVPGAGETVGRTLCNHRDIDGIVFTGGWETARAIQTDLAQRNGAIIPFIAETAGINAMITDSSAQPQQLVNDILRSAFDSAGQRCSALRVLYLPESCAAVIEQLLSDALAQLTLGDPQQWSTDIGPIIDRDAHTQLLDYLAEQRRRGNILFSMPAPVNGLFVPPTLIRLQRISDLQREAFGPLLHIIRYTEQDLEIIVDDINAMGYGLTCGIHSRNERYARQLAQRLRVGNIYINRDMIGAVVEAQPFGGMGKSGTGPKAGGPNYLQRFAVEKTVSINLSAMGGDYRLLSDSTSK
jgi:RHH-type transcriptional regulator, proline utilization regulon repressor / proline dehydrogenase / delta 1-pyrroline-5-carboxylate dehydrogenase